MARFKQLSCVINRTACRSIVAGAAFLVESVNVSSGDALTSEQRYKQLAANSTAACKFLENMELSKINHEHTTVTLVLVGLNLNSRWW